MPIFTGSPVITVPIDPGPGQWLFNTGGWPQGFSGPFHYGSAMYLCGYSSDDLRSGVVIAKSTDSGATWSYFWQGAGFPPEQWTGFTDVVLDSATGKLIFLALESFVNGNIATFYFDLGAETFSSIGYIAVGLFNGSQPFCLAQRPSGDLIAIYSQVLGGARNLMGVPIAANAFGTPFVIEAATGTDKFKSGAAVSDSSGTIHIAFTKTSPATLYYKTLDASNVPGTRQTIATGTFTLANGLIFGSQLIFCGIDSSYGTVFFVGDPISGPGWTQHNPVSGHFGTEIIAVNAGSVVKFLYIATDFVSTLNVTEADWDGSALGAEQVYWDIIANPPPGYTSGFDFQGVAALSAGFNSGTLEVGVTVVVNNSPFFDFSTVYVSSGGTVSAYQNKAY